MAPAAAAPPSAQPQQQHEEEGTVAPAAPLQALTARLATLLLQPPGQPTTRTRAPTPPAPPTPVAPPPTSTLLPKSQEQRFAAALAGVDDEIVALGGPTGGWGAREHATFLKLWRAFRGGDGEGERGSDDPVKRVTGNLRLLDRAAVALRGTSEAEVMRHIEWYERYMGLLEKKKALAQAWETARGATAVLAAVEAGPHITTAAAAAAAAAAVAAGPGKGKKEKKKLPARLEEKDPQRARTKRRLRAWRLHREAEAARVDAERRAQQARMDETVRAEAARKQGALRRRLERQRAARAAAEARKRAAEEADAEWRARERREAAVGKPLPAVVLERRALAAVKAAKARWEALRRREQDRAPGKRVERQRELLAGWRMEAAWRMEEDEQRYAPKGEGELRPDPHCALRHAGFVEGAGEPAKAKGARTKQQQPEAVVVAPKRPRPFLDLQFRDIRRLNQPTTAWRARAYTEEELVALDRRRHAGAHFQTRPPGFPPVLHL